MAKEHQFSHKKLQHQGGVNRRGRGCAAAAAAVTATDLRRKSNAALAVCPQPLLRVFEERRVAGSGDFAGQRAHEGDDRGNGGQIAERIGRQIR